MIRMKASLISNKDLIGRSGSPGMRERDKLQRGRLRLGKNFPWTIARQMVRLRQQGINISLRGRRKHNSPYVWKNNQMEEDTTLCSENNFLRSY
jgi:hypothetical protein